VFENGAGGGAVDSDISSLAGNPQQWKITKCGCVVVGVAVHGSMGLLTVMGSVRGAGEAVKCAVVV